MISSFEFYYLITTDGSKQISGVEAEETSSKICLNVPGECNVLQAKIIVTMNEQNGLGTTRDMARYRFFTKNSLTDFKSCPLMSDILE